MASRRSGALDLVDHHRRIDIDETGGIFLRRLAADAALVRRWITGADCAGPERPSYG
jgi:hypothetical protein